MEEAVDGAPSAKRPGAYHSGTCSAGLFSGRVPSRDGDGSVVTERLQRTVSDQLDAEQRAALAELGYAWAAEVRV